jgi:hypothetical protein
LESSEISLIESEVEVKTVQKVKKVEKVVEKKAVLKEE